VKAVNPHAPLLRTSWRHASSGHWLSHSSLTGDRVEKYLPFQLLGEQLENKKEVRAAALHARGVHLETTLLAWTVLQKRTV